jgi:antitoxin component of MazEF toxin-antitoxin module
MITSTIRKINDQYVVAIPEEEIDRLDLAEGQQVEFELARVQTAEERRKAIDKIMDEVVVEYREAFEYLAR